MVGEIWRLQIQDKYLKQRYAKGMPGVILRLQIQDNYLKQRYAKDIPKFCQRYAKDNYLKQLLSCQRYSIKEFVREMPKICQKYAVIKLVLLSQLIHDR